MTATRNLAFLAALAIVVIAGRDALGQAGGGTNQLSTQDTAGREAAKVNKIDALTIKQGAMDGASKDKGASRDAIKGEAIKGSAIKSDAIKGESSKDGTTGILIGLTPKPEADAAMSGSGAPGAARGGPSGIIGPVDHKAGGIIGPVDIKSGLAPPPPGGLAPPPPGVVSGPAAITPLPAQSSLPAVQAPAIKQGPALPPGGAFGAPGAPGMIKK